MSSFPKPPARQPWYRRLSGQPMGWLLLALLLLTGGYAGRQKWLGSKNPRDAYQIATVQRGDIQDLVTATGTVQPRDYVDVGAQVSGQLKKLHVEVGSVVQSGDLLAEIDPTVFSATVEARRAGLRNQRATLKERESALALATLQFDRQKKLAAEDATTTESLQIAEASLRSARAQIESVKAQIEQTESTLKADEATLSYARIYAPMSGTVVSVTARQGQTLNTNQSAPTVLRIADLSTMTVQTQVSEAEVSKLRLGMEVYFTTLGNQSRRWYGSLRKVEPTPTVTNNVVLYNALFDVPNNNQVLMPSMTTQVFFIAASAENVLMVPTAAVTMAKAALGRRSRSGASDADGKAASAPGTSTREGAPASAGDMTRRARREQQQGVKASEPGVVPRSSPAGFSSAGDVRTPRRGTVKLIDAQGRIEERAVELGIATRVQAEVLAGLVEGDQVLTGLKPPPTAPQGQQRGQTPSHGGGLSPLGSGSGRSH